MTIKTPILIANPRPFRLILRTADDSWSPSIEQINTARYDYVKLHRATKFFDAEIVTPFPLCVGFDGSFILPAVREYRTIDATLDEFNRIFASILVGGIYIESVEPEDLSQGEMTEFGYFRHTISRGGNGDLHKSLGNKDAGSTSAIILLNPPTILADELEAAYREGARVLKVLDNVSPSLLITGFTYFLNGQTRESLSHAWICIEQILDQMWRVRVIEELKSSHIAKRKRFLESQQWSAAHKVELMHQKGLISEDMYEKLTCARDARNHFIHRGSSPSREEAKTALDGLVDLLKSASDHARLGFKDERMRSYLKPQLANAPSTIVATADKVDWTKPLYWKAIAAIPGEEQWEGEFERFDDITLQRIESRSNAG
ncbi:DUF4145 domain-containing protein [Pseudacidovorax sp. NFM-22]|uniref:DUF4145 domain-containing protein n=1 Tax=Pseudacidovorax sp. NFM-22 TaxID=2744469 RepID=UPI001F186AB9|nr:DUF4145 domain-containing protein [Pseudacidovorax sp. NFM-22]